jgi:hypothetical protein
VSSLRIPRAHVDGSILVRPWLPPAGVTRALEVPVPGFGWSGDALPDVSRTSTPPFDIPTAHPEQLWLSTSCCWSHFRWKGEIL